MCLGLGLPRPSHAGALDDIASCLNAFSGYKSLAELGLSAADPEFLQCSAQIASGDVVLAATVVAIVGAGAAGAYGSKAECTNMTTGQIGMTISEILINTPGLSDALKAALGGSYEKLVQFAAGEAGSNIAQIPGLDQIFQYMSCGCTVYGKAAAVAAIAKGFAKDVKQCAGFIGNVGGAILDGLESGAEALGNLVEDIFPDAFGSTDETQHVQINVLARCDSWVKFAKPYTFSKTEDGGILVSKTTQQQYDTVVKSCTCYPPARFERQEDPAGVTDSLRCGCPLPVGGIYNPEARTCGCPADQRLEDGTCKACETEKFSETPQSVTVSSGRLRNGVCQPYGRTCPASETPVRVSGTDGNGATDDYQCQALCSPDEFFVKAPSAMVSAGSCGTCPKNFVPDAAAFSKGTLQCNECPARSMSGPGDRQCRQFKCPNGIDPANPHACRPACRLMGGGRNKRLVCDGGDALGNPMELVCPSSMTWDGSHCVPIVHHKPKEMIIHRERKTVTPDVDKLRKKTRQVEKERVREKKRPQADAGDVLVGPVERVPSGPSIGDLLNLGLDIGHGLDSGHDQKRKRRLQPTVPETDAEPRLERRPAPLTEDVLPTTPFSKD